MLRARDVKQCQFLYITLLLGKPSLWGSRKFFRVAAERALTGGGKAVVSEVRSFFSARNISFPQNERRRRGPPMSWESQTGPLPPRRPLFLTFPDFRQPQVAMLVTRECHAAVLCCCFSAYLQTGKRNSCSVCSARPQLPFTAVDRC